MHAHASLGRQTWISRDYTWGGVGGVVGLPEVPPEVHLHLFLDNVLHSPTWPAFHVPLILLPGPGPCPL